VLLGLYYLGVRADAVWRTTAPTLTEVSSLTELAFPPQTLLSGSSRRLFRDTMIARVVMPENHLVGEGDTDGYG
jgi:hypothetical protein